MEISRVKTLYATFPKSPIYAIATLVGRVARSGKLSKERRDVMGSIKKGNLISYLGTSSWYVLESTVWDREAE